MSNFRKSALTLAIVAGLAVSAAASAASISAPAAGVLPEGVAFFDIAGPTTQVGITSVITVNIDPSDNIIGRTTGFALRVTLNNGATFGQTPTVTSGTALPTGWSATIGAGGAGQNFVVINFNPPSSNPVPAITNGPIVNIAAAPTELTPASGHVLSSLTALQTSGVTVSEQLQFFDPVSTNPILNVIQQPVLQSGNPTVVSCAPTAGNINKKIDVGTGHGQASQTYFSSNGSIGLDDSGEFNAGSVTIAINPSFSYFNYVPATDSFTTTVNGSFGAFASPNGSVYLSANASCSTVDLPLTVNAGGTQASATYLGSAFPGGGITATGGTAYLCFSVPSGNAVPITATAVSVTTTFTRNALTVNDGTCSALPMNYNGPVVHVYTFNPAGNSTQQSFLRISDTGPAGGQVFISGIDDAGHPGAGVVGLTLGAGQSIQLTSTDLQSGNAAKGLTGALGTPTGKWRLTVTSYFPNLVVTSLNRNNNSGTVTNLTNYDVNGKQNLWRFGGDNGN